LTFVDISAMRVDFCV